MKMTITLTRTGRAFVVLIALSTALVAGCVSKTDDATKPLETPQQQQLRKEKAGG